MDAIIGNPHSSHYDELIRRYAGEFFGDLDVEWRWFKAQTFQESRFNPRAVSSAGAMGLMQLMPKTATEMAGRLGVSETPYDPEFSVMAGIAYDRRCWNIWKKEEGLERLRFMLASYNAGAGNIIKAQKLAVFKDRWSSVSAQLHKITGRDDAPETLTYVRRIEHIYGSF